MISRLYLKASDYSVKSLVGHVHHAPLLLGHVHHAPLLLVLHVLMPVRFAWWHVQITSQRVTTVPLASTDGETMFHCSPEVLLTQRRTRSVPCFTITLEIEPPPDEPTSACSTNAHYVC